MEKDSKSIAEKASKFLIVLQNSYLEGRSHVRISTLNNLLAELYQVLRLIHLPYRIRVLGVEESPQPSIISNRCNFAFWIIRQESLATLMSGPVCAKLPIWAADCTQFAIETLTIVCYHRFYYIHVFTVQYLISYAAPATAWMAINRTNYNKSSSAKTTGYTTTQSKASSSK